MGSARPESGIEQTVDPGQLSNFAPRVDGGGLVQPIGATRTQAVAFRRRRRPRGRRPRGRQSRRQGPRQPLFRFRGAAPRFQFEPRMKVRNLGKTPIAFKVTATPAGGAPHTVSFDRTTIFLDPRDDASLDVKLKVPAASVGSTHDDLGNTVFREVAGVVTLTPTGTSMNAAQPACALLPGAARALQFLSCPPLRQAGGSSRPVQM